MGNTESSSHSGPGEDKENLSSFPGSALVDALNCGGLADTDDTPKSARGGTAKGGASHGNKSRKGANSGNGKAGKHGGGGGSSSHDHPLSAFFSKTEELCATSPTNSEFMQGGPSEFEDEYEEFGRDGGGTEDAAGGGGEGDGLSDHHTPPSRKRAPAHAPTDPTSALFAKAMVSEVTDNPNTMTPAAMAERERRLLKAQDKARKNKNNSGVRPVGVPGGVGRTSVLGSIAHALTGTTDPLGVGSGMAMMMSSNNSSLSSSHDNPAGASVLPPNSMSENRAAQAENSTHSTTRRAGRHAVTIGLSLSRRSPVGHPDTVTRQTAFDFNELQDREYKYVSSTDSSGWRAGGGEAGKPDETVDPTVEEGNPTIPSPGASAGFDPSSNGGGNYPGTPNAQENVKDAAPDTVHIPIIHIDAESQQAVDAIISAIASGEVFIPHMAIIPEALSVNGVSPPDLVVRFGTERNDDLNPDEWPNWCLEFMHNQLYEYFHTMGAQWMKRPFSITLAKKVRWKTVKHMNRYFAHAEGVIDAWREKGPQYLDPQLAYIEGGATPEEVARPHGIYLLRNGIPTNYFAPNFDPPYTTKMTRSLLLNVLGKSWDKKRREWTSQPIPRLVTPSMLMTAMCGCGESQAGGFVATEATLVNGTDGMDNSTLLPDNADIHSYDEKPSSTLRKKKERKQSTPKSNASSKRDNAYSTTELGNSPASQPNDRAESPNRLSRIASSEVENSYVEERLLAQPDHPLNRMVTEADRLNKSVETQRKTSFSRTSGMDGDDLDVKLELQMSSASTSFDQSEANSTGNASSNNGRSALSAGSASSSKYGRPPTPEAFRSTRNALAPSLEEELMDRQQRHEKLTEQENKMAYLENSSAAFSVAAGSETVQPSETGTNSTIPRMNLSADKFIKKQKQLAENRGIDDDEKKEEDMRGPSALASDEDWLDELGIPLQTPNRNSKKKQAKASSSVASAALSKLDQIKEALDKEKKRQMELIALAQAQSSSLTTSYSLSTDRKDGGRVGPPESATEVRESSKRRSEHGKSRSPTLRKNDSGTSGISLEYSVESSVIGENSVGGSTLGTLNSTVGGGSTVGSSTLMGQHYTADGSTVASNVSRGTREIIREILKEGSQSGDISQESSFLSRQDSSASVDEPIPSDEDLFAVGWAKAFDNGSGSYYYFTLDRNQIVWENPFKNAPSKSQNVDGSIDESIPEGGVAL